jgi:hypothetical protein
MIRYIVMSDNSSSPSPFQSMSEEERLNFTRNVIAMLDGWKVADADQIKLLGVADDTRSRQVRSWRQGSSYLPDEPRVVEYVDHLLGIEDALRTSNPCNYSAGSTWMNRVNSRFKNRTPLAAMLEDGINSIVAVRIHLDCAYDWHIDAKQG